MVFTSIGHAAGKIQSSAVEVRYDAFGIGGVDRGRERIEQLPELRFAVREVILSLLCIRHIDSEAARVDELSVHEPNARGNENVADRPTLGPKPGWIFVELFASF